MAAVYADMQDGCEIANHVYLKYFQMQIYFDAFKFNFKIFKSSKIKQYK